MMAKRQIFYSYHFDNDVFRVEQIRNMGAVEANKPVSANDWEMVKRGGDTSIKKWIDENLKYKSCLVVLIGSETSNRKWVKYEIEKAWNDGMGVLGIYIHNLKCPRNGISEQGANPYEQFSLNNGGKLSGKVKCYNPTTTDPYNDIATNIDGWVEDAIAAR